MTVPHYKYDGLFVIPKKRRTTALWHDAVVLPTRSRAHLEGLALAAAALTLTYVEAEVVIPVTTEWILRRDYDNRLEVYPGSQKRSMPRANFAEMNWRQIGVPKSTWRRRAPLSFSPWSAPKPVKLRIDGALENQGHGFVRNGPQVSFRIRTTQKAQTFERRVFA